MHVKLLIPKLFRKGNSKQNANLMFCITSNKGGRTHGTFRCAATESLLFFTALRVYGLSIQEIVFIFQLNIEFTICLEICKNLRDDE